MSLFSSLISVVRILLDRSKTSSPDKLTTTALQPEMVLIKAGVFMMGSPKTERDRDAKEKYARATIENDFYMGKYEVTIAQFREFCLATQFKTENELEGDDDNWRRPFKGAKQKDDHPVLAVSWNDAVAYCQWLSEITGDHYRLPTEKEWEYACRAGTTTAFHYGHNLTRSDANFANYLGSTEGMAALSAKPLGTMSVGSFKPNAFGLYDMHGNAFEWCADVHIDDSAPSTRSGKYHIIKGGAWSMDTSKYCRAAHREGFFGGNGMMGFRVVKDVGHPA